MPHSAGTQVSTKSTIMDLKANGEVSRMRNHKGNMPSLPQTKYCSLCPAKFTRTTHLNRHLRSHTNERAHRCEICNAEFTRSDLLTRHKRTCGDSNVNRSRRKSCQACAESKVKCNLQQPCTKCSVRGKQCIYINDPEASRNKKLAKKAASLSTRNSETELSEAATSIDSFSPSSRRLSTCSFPSSSSQEHDAPSYRPSSTSRPHSLTNQFLPHSIGFTSPPDCASNSGGCSSRSSPRLEYFDPSSQHGLQEISNTFNTNSTPKLEINSPDLRNFFPAALNPYSTEGGTGTGICGGIVQGEGFSPSHSSSSPSSSSSSQHTEVVADLVLQTWLENNPSPSCANTSGMYGTAEQQQVPIYYNNNITANRPDLFSCGTLNLAASDSGKPSFSSRYHHQEHHFSSSQQQLHFDAQQQAASLRGHNHSGSAAYPSPETLNQYLFLFFTEFSIQIPIMHRPTWRIEMTHPILLSAMQACGALFAKRGAVDFDFDYDFIFKTLSISRDLILMEFAKSTCTLKDRMSLIISVVLLQSVGLLNPNPQADQRSLTRVYHDILIMMIRKTGLIKLIGSWPAPEAAGSHELYSAWKDWARYETLKRAILFAFIQDSSHTVYHSFCSTLSPSELQGLKLPCDDLLWKAQTAREWYDIQHAPENYGAGVSHAHCQDLQTAISVLKEPVSSSAIMNFTLNPFSAFLLAHCILREVFAPSEVGDTNGAFQGPNNNHNSIPIQCALHNWQRIWDEAVQFEDTTNSSSEIPFAFNALPFYWLAKIAEGARQNRSLNNTSSKTNYDHEHRYRLVRGWLHHINSTIRNFPQNSANLLCSSISSVT